MENARLITELTTAKVARSADRNRRGAEGHQPLDLRPSAGARCRGRERGAAVQGRDRRFIATRMTPIAMPPLLQRTRIRARSARDPIYPGTRSCGRAALRNARSSRLSMPCPTRCTRRSSADRQGALDDRCATAARGRAYRSDCARTRAVERFSDREIDLVTTFADQAVIAMENARLITETREALGSVRLRPPRFSRSSIPRPAISPRCSTRCSTRRCSCAKPRIGGSSCGTTASCSISSPMRNIPVSAVELLRAGFHCRPVAYTRGSSNGERGLFISRISPRPTPTSEIRVIARWSTTVAFAHRGVALRQGRRCSALIMIYRREVRPFTDKQIALLQNFAAQAVIAIENTRLITETQEALDQQTATAEVLAVINSSPGDLAPVFDAMVEKALHLCDAASGGCRLRQGDLYRSFRTCRRDGRVRGDPPVAAVPGTSVARLRHASGHPDPRHHEA